MQGDDPSPYEGVARGFDAIAERYDDLVEANPLHHSMREQSLQWLEEAFAPGERVLEVGCGLGTEAIHLGERGVEVVATDVSSAMVAGARERVQAAGQEGRVTVLRAAAGELEAAVHNETFDGAFASFGPLNCEPDLRAALESIAFHLRPTAPLLASVVSRPCISELAYGASVFRFRKAFRRLSNVVEIDLYGAGPVSVRAYSEAEARTALAPWFTLRRLEGLLVALPPPYTVKAWEQLTAVHRPVEWLDRHLRHTWPFRGMGDHLHIWATRHAE
ncbi:MAG: class I SAM-dependent methyltransferase [Thermoplasmata archaeon]